MQRVLVIGSGGAGKSTIAREIGVRTGLPVVHLDALYWHPGWIPTPDDEWRAVVEQLVARDVWVMDGNYGGTLAARLAACDTVVFLDLPRVVCLTRIARRWLRNVGRTRADMAAGCPERMTWEFVRWIWDYPRARRPNVLRRLAALPESTTVVVLRSRGAVRRFLATLRSVTHDSSRSAR